MMKRIIKVAIKYFLLLLSMDVVSWFIVKASGQGTLILIVMQVVIVSFIFMYHHGKIYDEKKSKDELAFKRVNIFFKYSSWTWKLITTPTDGNKMIREWKYEMIAYNFIYALVIPNIYIMLFLF